jgi:hypothetical protein
MCYSIVMFLELLQTVFAMVLKFTGHLHNTATNNYDSLTELHTPNITVN